MPCRPGAGSVPLLVCRWCAQGGGTFAVLSPAALLMLTKNANMGCRRPLPQLARCSCGCSAAHHTAGVGDSGHGVDETNAGASWVVACTVARGPHSQRRCCDRVLRVGWGLTTLSKGMDLVLSGWPEADTTGLRQRRLSCVPPLLVLAWGELASQPKPLLSFM